MLYKRFKSVLFVLSILFSPSLVSQGFSVGTLVKTADSYVPIEQLCVGDKIIGFDFEQCEQVTCSITRVAYKCDTGFFYIFNVGDDEFIVTQEDQLFHDPWNDRWLPAEKWFETPSGCIFLNEKFFCENPITLIELTVEPHHNFFVSHYDILVHNGEFLVTPVLALTTFGSIAAASILPIVVGVAAGGWLVLKAAQALHKSREVTVACDSVSAVPLLGSSHFQEDPDKNNKNEPRQTYRRLTNKEARELAEQLGYEETKNPPFNSHGELTFKKGNRWITPDNTGHKGGVWKMFDNQGRRLATYNADLTQVIGK
jgi:hypothetical protein